MDLEEHRLYVRYSQSKDTLFYYTDIKQASWYVVPSDGKGTARLKCIGHIISQFDYGTPTCDRRSANRISFR